MKAHRYDKDAFLSSNAQDFIEELLDQLRTSNQRIFLSRNAQDFIEDAIEISSYAIEWHS